MSEHAYFITALSTPLDAEDGLHAAGLEAHVADQIDTGIDSVLVAGAMGAQPLLRDGTYRELIRRTVELCRGKIELLVGAADNSSGQVLDRIEYINGFDVDGVVVRTPNFVRYDDVELVDFYTALAAASRAPLYLYDLPQVAGFSVPMAVVLEVARHPNIRGIKCSGPPEYAHQLAEALPNDFRIVLSQPYMVDVFLKAGYREQVDGVFGLAPRWTVAIGQAAARDDWDAAAEAQRKLSALLRLVRSRSHLPVSTAVLNARGIPGNLVLRPMRPLDDAAKQQLLDEPIVKQLVAEHSGSVNVS